MDLRLRTHDTGEATVVEVGGEVELYSAQQLRDALIRVCEVERPCIVVDLTRVSFIDSTGLGVLVGALKRASERGTLALVCPQQRVRRVLEITGLTEVFPMYDVLEDAVAACSQSALQRPVRDAAAESNALLDDGDAIPKVTADDTDESGGGDGS